MSVRQLDGAVGACLHTCEHGFKPHMSSAAGILREGNPEPRAGTLLRSILAASDCGAARIGLLSAVPQLQTTSADRTTVIAPISPTLSAQQLGLGVWPVLFMGHSSAMNLARGVLRQFQFKFNLLSTNKTICSRKQQQQKPDWRRFNSSSKLQQISVAK